MKGNEDAVSSPNGERSPDVVAEPRLDATSVTDWARLTAAIDAARTRIVERQDAAGYWQYELEADCTIPAEYVLMLHFLGTPEPRLEAEIATYLRRRQGDDGGWPLYLGGPMDLSCSVKVYFALRLAGDPPDAPHMRHAVRAILERGGAANANVFTRITLALFGELAWREVPWVPVEIMLLPRWFPFHPLKVSYWSRTVMIPLSVLTSLKPKARNPRGVHITELFRDPPLPPAGPRHSWLSRSLAVLDGVAKRLDFAMPRRVRARALERAHEWICDHLNGVHGLGAIFPAMVNAREALELLGYPPDHPDCRAAREALDNLLVRRGDETYCQPCVSPVWDTALTCIALEEDGAAGDTLDCALDWLGRRQLLDAPGDWRALRPHLLGGGWAFQFENSAYPDLDDTAVAALALHGEDGSVNADAVRRAADWLVGMQSANGGFASFDIDNDHTWLNQIPFADHGALLDPPTSDVTARVITFLATLARPEDSDARARALDFLWREQEDHGGWFGRWGTNYIYGTWSVLTALAAAGVPADDPRLRRAVDWLKAHQRDDGGWGETNDSYFEPQLAGTAPRSTACQTAWALLGLMAVGEARSLAVARGVSYLVRSQRHGTWHDREFNAPGFPRVFHLKYHGYSQYFPFWALARYRNAIAGRR